jgi:hypothetical protein
VSEVIAGAGLIRSSDERARLLMALLERHRLSAADAVAFLGRTGEMESGNRVRTVLVAALGRLPLGDRRVRDAYFGVVERMRSDAERRDVLVAVLAHGRRDAVLTSAAFRATHAMGSDANRREVLIAGVQGRTIDPSTRAAFMAALGVIGSDAERAAVVAALGAPGDASGASAPWSSTSTHRHVEDDVEQYRTELTARMVRLNPARDDVAAIDPGGSLTIHQTLRGGGSRTVAVSPSASGALRYEYRVNGAARTFDDDARAWMREQIRASAR